MKKRNDKKAAMKKPAGHTSEGTRASKKKEVKEDRDDDDDDEDHDDGRDACDARSKPDRGDSSGAAAVKSSGMKVAAMEASTAGHPMKVAPMKVAPMKVAIGVAKTHLAQKERTKLMEKYVAGTKVSKDDMATRKRACIVSDAYHGPRKAAIKAGCDPDTAKDIGKACYAKAASLWAKKNTKL